MLDNTFKSFTYNNYTYYQRNGKYYVIYKDYNMIIRKREITEELYNKMYSFIKKTQNIINKQ